ncbi:MAG TPA: hypothetical protein VK530_14140 [Candidatus Acidoferrum sp.]|nr:hypothetical protein [Candidatus Acidoferrum sp.]
MKREAQEVVCVNNLKQIALAAILFARESDGRVFPSSFMVFTNELNRPNLLFCPADPSGIRAKTWSEFNPATISYRLVNANVPFRDGEPAKPLVICPFHGTTANTDGSVYRSKK